FLQNSRRKAVRGEHGDDIARVAELRACGSNIVSHGLDVAVELMPAVDEVKTDGSPRQDGLYLAVITLGADARVMRRKHDGDQPVGTGVNRLGDGGLDSRRPVLHAE